METLQQIWATAETYLPNVLGAVAILIIGWIVARLIASLVKAALRRTSIDNRLAAWITKTDEGEIAVESIAARIVFYTIMVFVLIAFFQTLGLTMVTEPLNGLLNEVFAFLPRLFGAVALAVVAWVLASGLRMITGRALAATDLDRKVGEHAGAEGEGSVPLSKTLSEAVYWLVFLLFLPAILGTLALQGLLEPVQMMVNKVLEYLPNVITAVAILAIGWFVARVVQRVIAGLLAALGVDNLSERIGLAGALGTQRLSGLLALVAYVLILIPVIISSLNALGLDAITDPASNMLGTMLNSLPNLFAAALVLGIAYAVGRVVSDLATRLLDGAGFNTLFSKLGFNNVPEGAKRPAALAGTVVLAAVMMFAAVEAFGLLGFAALSDVMTQLMGFGGHLIVAMVIAGLGLWLSELAASTLRAGSSRNAAMLATAARVAILVLTGAMALRELGVAEQIITLAFGLSLGAVAVALAIAFGVGGRDAAARQLDQWQKNLNN